AKCVGACCCAAGGSWNQAAPIAAGVEVFMTALDLLDDVEDEEGSEIRDRLGPARFLNASTGLLCLGLKTLANVENGAQAVDILLTLALASCAGQDADLSLRSDGAVDLEGALEITQRKSASLAAAACRLGAFCAGASKTTQERYERFGACLGITAQLANDLAALGPGARGKTDTTLRRPTLPLVHAAQLASRPSSHRGNTYNEHEAYRRGPAQLTWAVAEMFRRQAIELIPQLTNDPAGQADLASLPPVI
ncbi:MAG: polyprenyl synthetase family protein, partial [Chloroflexota bacterium]|nr:polyprenyl synthetase family protein [Chloroflexota bacterium]